MPSVPQFLTNPDGSVPPGTDVTSLEAAGVLLVRPTTPPTASGKVAVEGDPGQDGGGVWRQTWTLADPPPAPPGPRQILTLAFLDRLSPVKQVAVNEAGKANAMLGLLTFRLGCSQVVDLDDPQLVAGVDALVGEGVLEATDKTALLL